MLFASLARLSPAVLNREKVAIIIPVFFYDPSTILPQCRALSSCIRLSLSGRRLMRRGNELFPEDRYQLLGCIRARVCSIEKMNVLTHVGVGRCDDD